MKSASIQACRLGQRYRPRSSTSRTAARRASTNATEQLDARPVRQRRLCDLRLGRHTTSPTTVTAGLRAAPTIKRGTRGAQPRAHRSRTFATAQFMHDAAFGQPYPSGNVHGSDQPGPVPGCQSRAATFTPREQGLRRVAAEGFADVGHPRKTLTVYRKPMASASRAAASITRVRGRPSTSGSTRCRASQSGVFTPVGITDEYTARRRPTSFRDRDQVPGRHDSLRYEAALLSRRSRRSCSSSNFWSGPFGLLRVVENVDEVDHGSAFELSGHVGRDRLAEPVRSAFNWIDSEINVELPSGRIPSATRRRTRRNGQLNLRRRLVTFQMTSSAEPDRFARLLRHRRDLVPRRAEPAPPDLGCSRILNIPGGLRRFRRGGTTFWLMERPPRRRRRELVGRRSFGRNIGDEGMVSRKSSRRPNSAGPSRTRCTLSRYGIEAT